MTGDGESWLLIGASPDLRQQLAQTPQLWPPAAGRGTPVAGVVLIGGDIDAIAGLLVMRERQPFTLYAPGPLLRVIAENSIFNVLDPAVVQTVELFPMQSVVCAGNLRLTLLAMPGKVPLYQEDRGATNAEPAPTYAAQTYAAMIETNGRSMIVAPACADITEAVLTRLRQVDVVLFDGTLFTDHEMVVAGLGEKTGARMGHVSLSGPNGTLVRLADLPARRILFHINNTNPILLRDSPERRQVEAAGFEIAFDGMELCL